jgi:hypothetical protein
MSHLPWILLSLVAGAGEGSELRIDPLLVATVVEAYAVIARADNPVWPGWDASDTPVLLYLPGVQDVLLNHPKPPPGFRRVPSELVPASWTVDVRDGETTFTLDGQNTSTTVNGIETLVVADPLSNVRPGLVQLLDDPRPTREKEPELTVARLTMDPYDELAMVVHEAFHVHQARRAPNKAASEAWLLEYPWLSAENNALFALEGECLARALGAPDGGADEEAAFEAGLEWLAVRAERRAKLPAQAVQYEDGTEFNEGLAKYVEWRASEAFEGKPAGAGLRWARGFLRGWDGLGFWRTELLRQLASHSSGETIVNGDPYGSGGLRFRLYFTGMAQGVLLDRLGAEGWHERIFEGGTTLTGLVEEVLAPEASERGAALARAKERCKAPGGFAAVLARKKELEAAGLRAAQAAAERILTGPALFTLDFSGVDAPLGIGFTPFGLTRVDAARTIYGQIPMRAELGAAASFQQASTAPILVDSGQKKLWFQLAAPVDAAELARLAKVATLGSETLTDLELALPGVKVEARRAVLRSTAGGVELVLVK